MNKTKLTATLIAIAAVPMPALAYTNPTVFAQSQVMRSMYEGQAERDGARVSSRAARSGGPSIATSCGRLPEFRAQYGSRHPQVVKLQSLCRRAGY